jgi:hypothetical protein
MRVTDEEERQVEAVRWQPADAGELLPQWGERLERGRSGILGKRQRNEQPQVAGRGRRPSQLTAAFVG